jgi:4-amino-4-deoxy-L-arabinose transferase-like glycosyltransferase
VVKIKILEPQRTQRSTEESSHLVPNLTASLRIPDWFLLIAVCAFFFFWKLAAFGLIGADEPRYAQVAREMLERHDWITPTLGGTPWLEKPPLYYWQAMIAYGLFGVSDWAARLPAACDATVLVIGVYWLVRRLRRGSELDAALVLATCAGLVGYARAASMDIALCATFTLAMLSWYLWIERRDRKFLALTYLFVALATLAKGPVAPFLGFLVIACFAAVHKSAGILRRSFWLPGIALFLTVSTPWYMAVQLRNPQFFRVFILEHNLARFGTNLYHHPEPFWYYVPVTLLGWVPWAVLLIAGLVWWMRNSKGTPDQLNTLLVIWITVIVLFFSISQSKLPGYVLPAIPAGAVLVSQWIRTRTGDRPTPAIAAPHSLAAGALVFPALMIQYILLDAHNLWSRAALVPAMVAFVLLLSIFLLLWKIGWRTLRAATLAPAVVVTAVVLRFGSASLDQKLSARPVSDELSRYDHRHLPIATMLVPRETQFGLDFYRNQVMPRYEVGQIPRTEHLLVAAQGYQSGMEKRTGRKVTLLENIASQKLDLFYVAAK